MGSTKTARKGMGKAARPGKLSGSDDLGALVVSGWRISFVLCLVVRHVIKLSRICRICRICKQQPINEPTPQPRWLSLRDHAPLRPPIRQDSPRNHNPPPTSRATTRTFCLEETCFTSTMDLGWASEWRTTPSVPTS